MSNDLLQPRYAEGFRCLGGDCQDNCCRGWDVYVDKPTYKKYRKTPSLRSRMSQHIELNPGDRDNFKYARIKFKPGGICPFLDANKLCGIQKEHGPDYLSRTCSRYPRALARFEGRLQKALYLSCPEAARQVLLTPNLLSSSATDGGCGVGAEVSPTAINSKSLPAQLREIALQLVQDRSYPLWQRLFVLGIVCRRVHELMVSQQENRVPSLIAEYAAMMAQGRLRSHLEGIPSQPAQQLELVLQLLRTRFQIGQPEDAFSGSVGDFLSVIQTSSASSRQDSAARYHEAHVRHYQPFAETQPAFLENYVLNYIFRTRFPFADIANCTEGTPDPCRSHVLMALHYRLLHSLLIGAAARYGDRLTSEHAVRLVQGFARGVEHNVGFLDHLKSLAGGAELRQTDGLAVLLANP